MITYKEIYFILQYVNKLHLSKATLFIFSFILENGNIYFIANCAILLYLIWFQLRETNEYKFGGKVLKNGSPHF